MTSVTEPHGGSADPAGRSTAPRVTTAASRPRREVGIDLARGVALISMFVAHTAPSAGPGGIFQVSEYLTFPLFALLVGAGAALGARAYGLWEHGVRTLVQAALLLGVGYWLEGSGAQIVIVLAPLGVLTLVAWGIARLPSVGVVVVGVLAAVAAQWTLESSRETALRLVLEDSAWSWWFNLLVSPTYPMAVLVTMACAGVLMVRTLVPATVRGATGSSRVVLATWVTAALTLAVSVVLLGLVALDRVDVVAYVTSPWEQVLITCLAVGVTALCLGVAAWPSRAWQWCVGALAAAGGMTLTLYTLHTLWLAWWVTEFRPGQGDDTWVNVVGLSVGAVLVALVWRAVVRPRWLARGPLESVAGLVGVLASRVR